MFKVGDRVRIRDWDDMEREYGTDSDGDIFIGGICFFKTMRCLCGRYATIDDIYENGVIVLKDWSDTSDNTSRIFAKSMLEPAEENTLKRTTVTIDKCGINISQGDVEWLKENKEKGEEKDMNKILELYCFPI